jgi:hypothetical protein
MSGLRTVLAQGVGVLLLAGASATITGAELAGDAVAAVHEGGDGCIPMCGPLVAYACLYYHGVEGDLALIRQELLRDPVKGTPLRLMAEFLVEKGLRVEVARCGDVRGMGEGAEVCFVVPTKRGGAAEYNHCVLVMLSRRGELLLYDPGQSLHKHVLDGAGLSAFPKDNPVLVVRSPVAHSRFLTLGGLCLCVVAVSLATFAFLKRRPLRKGPASIPPAGT